MEKCRDFCFGTTSCSNLYLFRKKTFLFSGLLLIGVCLYVYSVVNNENGFVRENVTGNYFVNREAAGPRRVIEKKTNEKSGFDYNDNLFSILKNIQTSEYKKIHSSEKDKNSVIPEQVYLRNGSAIKSSSGTTIPATEDSWEIYEDSDYEDDVEDEPHNDTGILWSDLETIPKNPPLYLSDYKNPCWRTTIGIRCLPYFFILGQPKSGTTDLYFKILKHPDVFKGRKKEPHWWTRRRIEKYLGNKRGENFNDYMNHFNGASKKIEEHTVLQNGQTYHPGITVDGSASTLWDNRHWFNTTENQGASEPKHMTMHLIKKILPNSKFIVSLRNPTERLYSGYLYFNKYNKSLEDFHWKTVKAVEAMTNCTKHRSLRYCAYSSTGHVRLNVGMYSIFLQDWFEVFPKDRFLVLNLEHHSSHTEESLVKIFKFLGLRPLSNSETAEILEKPAKNTRSKKNKKLGDLLPETRALLDEFYKPFNQKLSQLLGDPKFLWKNADAT